MAGSILIRSGNPLPLELILPDGAADKFPQAHVYDPSGNEVSGSPFNLTHAALGRYTASYSPAAGVGRYVALYRTYTDAGYTTESNKYGRCEDVFDYDDFKAEIEAIKSTVDTNLDAKVSTRQAETDALSRYNNLQSKLGTPAGVSVSADIAAVKSDSGTLVSRLTAQRAVNLDNLDAAITSREAETDASARYTNLQTKLGTPAGASVSADIAAVKSDSGTLVARLTAQRATNLDFLDVAISSRESEASASTRATNNQNEHDATQALINALNNLSTTDIQTVLNNQGLTTSRTANLDNLNATISSRESESNAASRAAAAHSDALAIQSDIAALPTAEEITDAVLDEPIADHLAPGTVGEAIASSGATTPTAIADAVWDSLVADHAIPNTFGDFIAVIKQYAQGNNNILTNGTYGPQALRAIILNMQTALTGEINQNETKIDAIIPAVNLARDQVIAEVDIAITDIGALSSQLTSAQSVIISEIDQNEVKIDALSSQVGTIQNNTTTRFIVPSEIYKPESGSKDYQFHLRLYDTVGNPEAPDVAPTIRIRRLDTGVDIVSGAAMTQLGANVGAYFYTFAVTSGTALFPLLVEATVTENGVSRLVPAVSEIVEFQSDLDAIQAAVAAVDTKTLDIQSKVNNPTFGLSALKSGQTSIVNEVNQNEVKIDAIKTVTDALPNNIATVPDVQAVDAHVLALPSLAQIVTQLNLIRDSIKGTGNRTITEAYDKIDFTNIAKTNDPRFNYLDAAISSRGTLTAAQVWTYATRTMTSIVLPPAEVEKVWNVLTSGMTTPNSIGKLIKDMLDVAVSTRATQGQVASALAGVAQETTVSAGFGATASSLSALASTLTLVQNLSTLIKAKTDALPASPASEATLLTETTQIDVALSNLSALVTLIQAKTNLIPPQPAKEGSVLAIPTNPLLSSDARLSRLDVNVSTRSTLSLADLANLVNDTEFANGINQVLSALAPILSGVNSANSAIVQRPTSSQMDTKLAPLAKTAELNDAASDILDAIANIPGGGGGGATPAQIWSYATRTLTASPTDISGLATAAQVAALGGPTYHNRMSTVFKNSGGQQEVIAWAEKNGQRVIGSDCTVLVKDASGVTKWSATLASPNADGVFKFLNAITVGADENYYIVIEIKVDGVVRRSQEPFFTVG